MSTLPNRNFSTRFAFGEFEFSEATLELRSNGQTVKLQPQPGRVLAVLLERRGQLVTREDLRREVWDECVYVDFDDAVNHNIKYLRDALSDSAISPRFIQTVPRRGYRFVAEVRELPSEEPAPAAVSKLEPMPQRAIEGQGSLELITPDRRPRWRLSAAALVAIAFIIPVVLVTLVVATPSRTPRVVSVRKLTHFGLANKVMSDGHRLFIEEEKGGHYSIVEFPLTGDAIRKPLASPFANMQLLDIAPDGQELLIASFEHWTDPRLLWRYPLYGGSPRRVADVVANSAKWSPDGSRIAFSGHNGATPDGVYVINGDGSGLRKISENCGILDGWSPDGASIRCTRISDVRGGMSIWQVRLAGGAAQLVLPEKNNPNARWGEGLCCGRWTRDGRYFIFRESTGEGVSLWAVAERGALEPFVHQSPVQLYPGGFDVGDVAPVSIAPDGRRAFVVGRNQSRELLRYDRKAKMFVSLQPELGANFVSWSPDRKFIAYSQFPGLTLWKMNADGSARLQLTSAPMQVYHPIWSPDGQRLAFHTLLPGKAGKICVMPASGGTPQMLFPKDSTEEDAQNWSPDGSALMFSRVAVEKDAGTHSAIWIYKLKSGELSKLPGSDDLGPPAWSPDGRYVVAQSHDFDALMLFDFRSGNWSKIATGSYIHFPQWSDDGRYVIYQDLRTSEEQPIYRVQIGSGRVEKVAGREQILSDGFSSYRLVALTPDDQPVVSLIRYDSDVYALDLDLP